MSGLSRATNTGFFAATFRHFRILGGGQLHRTARKILTSATSIPTARWTYSDAYNGNWGVRPLCVLKSEILKSYLDGDMKKRAEAVDMMKHIAAAWNIQPEEVFEEGR